MIHKLFYIESERQKKWWLLFHIILGLVSTISSLFLIIWFYFFLFNATQRIINSIDKEKKLLMIVYTLAYSAPIEIASRVVDCSPFIPYELGKYLTFVLLTLGISNLRKPLSLGYVVLFFALPGIILGWIKVPDYRYIIFNIMGVVNYGLGIVFFGGLYLNRSKIEINKLIRFILYPLLIAMVYVILKTPSYNEIDFNLGANFETSGGFGSNQVSTAFGLAFFLLFYQWYSDYNNFGFNRVVDLFICGLFLFQGLLTFSRGGIIGGVLAVIILIIGKSKNNQFANIKKGMKGKVILIFIPLALLFVVTANFITDGNLLLRYSGETQGTLLGTKEKDINSITTGRFNIFLGDLNTFLEYPLFGVGVNESRNYRVYHNGVVAHVELSRLLSEHGILGLIIFFFFLHSIYLGIKKRYNILFLFAFIGLYTSFHAATRTFISPLFMALAYIPGNSIYRGFTKLNSKKFG